VISPPYYRFPKTKIGNPNRGKEDPEEGQKKWRERNRVERDGSILDRQTALKFKGKNPPEKRKKNLGQAGRDGMNMDMGYGRSFLL